jgi:hypothetical protein
VCSGHLPPVLSPEKMAGMSQEIQTIFTAPKEDSTWYLTDILAAIGGAILESLW